MVEEVAGFFVEVDAGGEVEGVDEETEDDESGGLEGRGAFVLPKCHHHHKHHEHHHNSEPGEPLPAFVGFEVDYWVVGTLVDDAARDHSKRQCANRHIDGKEEYRPEKKAVFYRVHVIDGEISRFAYRLVEIVGFGVVFPVEVWTVVGIRFKEVGAVMCAHHHAACVVAALVAVARLVVHGRVSVNLRGWLNVVFHKIGVFTREEGACHLFFGAEQLAETLADVKHVDVANVNHLASVGQHRLLERCHQQTAT